MCDDPAAAWAALRVEWSKGWAYTDDAAWQDAHVLSEVVPAGLRTHSGTAGWDEAAATLRSLDPHGVFISPLLDVLLT